METTETAKKPDDTAPTCVHGVLTRLRCSKCAKAQLEADLIAQRANAPDTFSGRDGRFVEVEDVQTDLDSQQFRAKKNIASSSLLYLYHRKVILPYQYEAGCRYGDQAALAGGGLQVNYDPDQAGQGSGDPFTLTKVTALEFLNRVHNALSDRDASIVDWLCALDMGLGDISKKGRKEFPPERPSPWMKDTVPSTVRNALHCLAEVTGHATKSGRSRKSKN
ncbi:hypothetical protein QMT40_001796 [Parvibaculaceae bacterium PLY_AMNH_Bact1]|nr:hypothetical protein QMT40_001796 [Parvibaculaceae bacterium PLY_AMNH_Bact1]